MFLDGRVFFYWLFLACSFFDQSALRLQSDIFDHTGPAVSASSPFDNPSRFGGRDQDQVDEMRVNMIGLCVSIHVA